MSLAFARLVEDVGAPVNRADERELLAKLHRKEFWKEEKNEETGEIELVPIDGRTQNSFKDETDINKILAKAQKTGTVSHLAKHALSYGDFSDVPDLLEAQNRLVRGREIFAELPSEVRKEFGNDMFSFFEYVNDPANKESLEEKLPALAAPDSRQ